MGLGIEKRSGEINGTLICYEKTAENPVEGRGNAVTLVKKCKKVSG